MQEQIEGYRLSPQQTQLYLGQRAGARPLLAQCVVRLTGALDEASLREAVGRSVARHAILRTRFVSTPTMKLPLQVISEDAHFDWRILDTSTLTAAVDETHASIVPEHDDNSEQNRHDSALPRLGLKLLEQERAHTFDLGQGPVLHAALFALSPLQHLLVLTLPALCADTRTLSNLVAELASDYGASVRGEQFDAATAAEEAVQYLQFSEWQNELLADDNAAVGREFWRRQEAAGDAVRILPFASSLGLDGTTGANEAHTVAPSSKSGRVRVLLNTRIAELAAELKSSEDVLLLSCWEVLVQRLVSGDALIAKLHDGRKYDELHSALGHFARALPLRTSVRAGIALSELVREVGERVTEAAEWQEYYVAETVNADAETAVAAGIGFGYERRKAVSEASRVRFEVMEQEVEGESSGIRLRCVRAGGELWAEVDYAEGVYEREWIEAVGAEYASVVESAVRRGADAQVDSLEMLPPSQQQLIINTWNNTAVTWSESEADYDEERTTLHQLVERQVERTPDAIALTFEGTHLSYAQLNERANQLAHHLLSLGIRPDTQVGVMMERSVELVVALLAILKAGGAYVPLDPSYPQERLTFMLADARVPVLLTQAHLVERLAASQHAQVLAVDLLEQILSEQPTTDPTVALTGEHLAYMIYTSGSTGQPKGAMNTHRAIANRLLWMQQRYRLDSSDVVLQKTPFSFDVSVWEFFWPLLTGARLVVARPEGHRDAAYLVEVIKREGVTTLHFVPPMLGVWLEEEGVSECRSIRRIICSGEALSPELATNCLERLPAAQLHNLYGPTEAAVDVTAWECRRSELARGVPIGRPIANIGIYILDRELRPVPVGMAGELYIGGVGLARGYHARPALTAEKFIPHPFSRSGGERLYRTGDVARFRPDGEVEYLGRADQQVKVRGYRIELGEIETALREYEGVREAVVVAREDVIGDKRLVAYLVAATDSELSIADIRRRLHEQLPDYMMPAAIVTVMTLPLTPNGKIDRAALPAPGLSRAGMEEAYVEPRTALEGVIANIWAETIGVERVGVRDNFFELGGHSLLVTQVITRVREEFDVELAVREMFEGMTVEEMAAAIESREGEAGRSEKIARVMREVEEMSEGELIEKLQLETKINENQRLD